MNIHVVNSSLNFKFCLKLFQPLIFILQVEIKTHYNLDAQLEFCRPVAFLTWPPHGSVVTP